MTQFHNWHASILEFSTNDEGKAKELGYFRFFFDE